MWGVAGGIGKVTRGRAGRPAKQKTLGADLAPRSSFYRRVTDNKTVTTIACEMCTTGMGESEGTRLIERYLNV